jgi:hypothetical protein
VLKVLESIRKPLEASLKLKHIGGESQKSGENTSATYCVKSVFSVVLLSLVQSLSLSGIGIVRMAVRNMEASEAARMDLGAGPPMPIHVKKAWRGRVSGI